MMKGLTFLILGSFIFALLTSITSGETNEVGSTPLARVEIGGKWGFIDMKGSMVIPAEFSDALSFCNGMASVKKGEKWGYIDGSGRMVIEPSFDLAMDFRDSLGLIAVWKTSNDLRWGFVDESGKLVSTWYENAFFYSENLAAVKSEGKFGFIDKTGRLTIGLQFDDARYFSQNLAAVCDHGVWGYVKPDGR